MGTPASISTAASNDAYPGSDTTRLDFSALRLALRNDGFGDIIKPLAPLKMVGDDQIKLLVRSSDGKSTAVVFWSNAAFQQKAAADARNAERISAYLGEELGKAILKPIAVGDADGRSYAIWPYKLPLSSWAPFRAAQHLALRPRLFLWLTDVVKATMRHTEEAELRYQAALGEIASDSELDPKIRHIAERGISRMHSAQWTPFEIVAHNDFHTGNVLLPLSQPFSSLTSSQFWLMDCGAAEIHGCPIYDAIRLALSIRGSQGRFKQAIISHCRTLECSAEDAQYYLAAAFGRLRLRRDQFPKDKFNGLVNWCFEYFRTTIK